MTKKEQLEILIKQYENVKKQLEEKKNTYDLEFRKALIECSIKELLKEIQE